MASSGTNDLWAKFAPKPGTWRCSTCLVENASDKLKCVCCEADAPASVLAAAPAQAAAPAPAPAPAGFNFGAAAATTGAAPAATFNFGFGAPAPAAAPPAPAAGGFSFGFGAPAPAAASAPAPAAAGFNFGFAAPAPTAAAPAPATGFNFGFGGAAAAAPASSSEPERKDKFGAHDLFAGGTEDSSVPAVPAGAHKPSAANLAPLTLVAKAPVATHHVYTVGSGECEQLGHGGDYPSLSKPRLVRALFKVPIVRIAVGGLHTLALTATGKVWSWGCNDDQALGRPGGVESVPGLVRGPLDGVKVTLIGAGDSHSCAVDEDGAVYAWGTYKGADGYLGFDAHTQKQATPRPMTTVAAYGKAVQLSCAADHTGVTTDEGIAVVWGYGGQGQLGRNPTERDLRGNRTAGISLTPSPIHIMRKRGEAAAAAAAAEGGAGIKRKRSGTATVHRKGGEYEVAAVHCAGYSTFVVVKDGAGDRVYACGLNTYGQLGLGDTENRTTPVEVEGLRGKGVLQIVGGSQHSLALAADGSVYGFGRADSGQLGLRPRGTAADAKTFTLPVAASAFVPVRLPPSSFGGVAVASISASSCSSAAVAVDGKVYAWGFGESGQLGNNDGGDEKLPHAVNGEGGHAGELKGVSATAVGMGGQHLVVLGSGGVKAAALAADTSDAVVEATKVVEDPKEEGEEDEEEEGGDDGSEGGEEDDEDEGEEEEEEEEEKAPPAKKARTA